MGDPSAFSATDLGQATKIGSLQGLMQGSGARGDTLAMMGAAMGMGPGYGADALQRRLGTLYDVYASQQRASGAPVGTFVDFMNNQMNIG